MKIFSIVDNFDKKIFRKRFSIIVEWTQICQAERAKFSYFYILIRFIQLEITSFILSDLIQRVNKATFLW